MGSGSSKVVIKRVSPEVQVSEQKAAVNVDSKQGHVNDIYTDYNEGQPTTIEETEDNIKLISETLKDTEETLKSRGFTDPVLVSHCNETDPALFDVLVKLYGNVQTIKENRDQDEFISVASKPLRSISSLYQSSKKSFRVKKGNLLADIGYGHVFKILLDKLLASYPSMLTYIKTAPSTENEEEQMKELKKEKEEEQTKELKKEKEEEQTNELKKEIEEDQSVKEVKIARSFLELLLKIAINYTDLCDAMNVAFSKAGLVPVLVDIVENLKDCTAYHIKFMDSSGKLGKKTARGIHLSLCLGTLHNMSKRVPTRVCFHACDAVKVILPMIDDPITFFATKALLVLAYLIDESNNELIMANEGPIKFLISLIERATKMTNRRYLGLSCGELANGLAQIAINDRNKKLIVANEAIPVLINMINGVKEEEQIEGVKALWVLSFDEDNRTKMRETEGLLEMLKSFKDSSNEELQNAASGALWEIQGKENHSESSSELQTTSSIKNHVMISYQWDVQKIMLQVKNCLQATGFRVWMDLEQMGGSTLEAMARAVEDSSVVLICISQRYKESSNCRSEAEYAFQLKKDIIPLMMESKYRPDGWLGMIMGSKLWIDLSHGQRTLDTSFKDLVKELGDRGKAGNMRPNAINIDVVDVAPSAKIDISSWTNQDVMKWISGFGLEIKKKNTLKKLTGSMLILLHTLRNESPDYYYSSLREEVGLFDVYSVLRFTHELEKLVG